jgi:coproporphyrinogen III oxidase-like Fe-S oxidoreductase
MNPYYLYRQKNMAGNFENVGYARPGCECLYNILIMEERQTILGAGCGAASKFMLDDGRVERAADVKNLTRIPEPYR